MSENLELLQWTLNEIEQARLRLFEVGSKLIELHTFDAISENGDELMVICRALEKISGQVKKDFEGG